MRTLKIFITSFLGISGVIFISCEADTETAFWLSKLIGFACFFLSLYLYYKWFDRQLP